MQISEIGQIGLSRFCNIITKIKEIQKKATKYIVSKLVINIQIYILILDIYIKEF